jgi:hypothetical protein
VNARVAAGNAPPSAKPTPKRATASPTADAGTAVNAVLNAHNSPIPDNALRGPIRSANQPPGIWSSVYGTLKAEKISPIKAGPMPSSVLMVGAAIEMFTRSIYVTK